MARTLFERKLQDLSDRLLTLGSEVEGNIGRAVAGLAQRDSAIAHTVITEDQRINHTRINLMMDALTFIATQQPLAGDMRLTAAIIEIAGELERINDYAKGISEISLRLADNPDFHWLPQLPLMAKQTQSMLHRAMTAVIRQDVTLAQAIPVEDQIVDDWFNEIYRDLVGWVSQNPHQIDQANQLEWAAHNLERAADRVTNICEWGIYALTGVYVEIDA